MPPQADLYDLAVANFVESAYVYTDPALREPVLPKHARNPKQWLRQVVDHQVDVRQSEMDMAMWHDAFAALPPTKRDWQSVIKVFKDVEEKYRHQRFYRADNTFSMWSRTSSDLWRTELARRRVLSACFEVMSYRNRLHKMPATLPKFGDDADPFTNQSLKYVITSGDHFMVYSVGPDEKDDNGHPRGYGGPKTWDIAYSF